MQVVSCASRSWRLPALLARETMAPVAAQTWAQSRLRRTHATNRAKCSSDRHASAQVVQLSTPVKQASMQALIAAAWAGWAGCDRNMARTTAAVIGNSLPGLSPSFGLGKQPIRQTLVP